MNNQELNNDWLEIGTIVAPQGLKGELRVYPSSDFPERFLEPGIRWLQDPKTEEIEEIDLLHGRYLAGKNLYIITIDGVEDRETAESLKGYKILVEQGDLPELAEDEYHVSELIGLEVYHQETGEKIGVVTDLFTAGNDLLEVRLEQQPIQTEKPIRDLSEISRRTKRKQFRPKPVKPVTILIPFVKEIVTIVDLEKGRLELNPPAGLLEIY
ncbi:Ribosome maturation factor rimM [Stanieria cyanosphaera PCC 7437]|uniref:Ribosome maturation factor RimM n=1 Tax=Stanieria cyanosphaera (strain ATCC 29371 / PCC 7437) TaxID=111780 RepID=K9XS13_STAC7|nr:ribosome maturation factor RimM [Stanieria cyanosphaera]AFZ35395.1 Ribosome maturation factor rimM [Stanieria cyanosphaera PCC 7437]